MVWIKFIICVFAIFFAGRKVARYGDIIADRTGLGGVWIGVILVSLITSLPELFTGISAVTIVKEPDLTVGDLIGANAFNMFNLAMLDVLSRNRPLLASVSSTHTLTGWFSIILVLLVGVSIFTSARFSPMAVGWVGWYTPALVLLYIVLVRFLFKAERGQYDEEEKMLFHEERESNRKVYLYFSLSSICIIAAGVWLATIGNEIALTTGFQRSFVGSLFLAFSTTLPELTVSFTAMRMGAKDLAVANLIGSNLFNMTIIAVGDLCYLPGPLLASVGEGHLVTAVTVVALTLLFMAGLRFQPRRFFRFSWWNTLVIALFLISTYFSFTIT